MQQEKLSPAKELLHRIIDNWGKPSAMSQMEQWIIDYGKAQHPVAAGWVKAVWGLIPDGIHSMKLASADNVEMRGTGLVSNNEITLITFLNKTTMGVNDLPKDYEGVYYLDETGQSKKEAVVGATANNISFEPVIKAAEKVAKIFAHKEGNQNCAICELAKALKQYNQQKQKQ